MRFLETQVKHAEWQKKNFPPAEGWAMILGLQEELGELSHAYLKRHQSIRKGEDHGAMIQDAVGDIVMYLCAFCTAEGLSLEDCVEAAWQEIVKRDWKKNPDTAHENGQGHPSS